MKLLFAYFDCDSPEAVGAGRGLGEQSLNFSTEYDFAVRKELLAGNNGTYYWLSSKWKPEEERIPAGFWSNRISEKQSYEKRIYNVSALVGSNGSGKSTLLHSLIKTLVEGLDPELPFLLVLQQTGASEPFIYSNMNCLDQEESGLEPMELHGKYPKALRRAKIMLIDNTLSVSSMDLMQKDYEQSNGLRSKIRSGGWSAYRQFCNKSLSASIQYSNDISEAGRSDDQRPSVFDGLANYFQYESYQELRTLFDPFLWGSKDTPQAQGHSWDEEGSAKNKRSFMEMLREQGHSVPKPRYLYVSVESIDQLCKAYLPNTEITWLHHEQDREYGFLDRVCVDLLISLFVELLDLLLLDDHNRYWIPSGYVYRGKAMFSQLLFDELNELFNQAWKRLSGGKRGNVTLHDARVIPNFIMEGVKKGSLKKGSLWYLPFDKRCSDYEELFKFLENNQDRLEALFQPCAEGEDRTGKPDAVAMQMPNAAKALYRVDIEQTLRDEKLRSCLMDFLQAYRAVSSRVYFLSFSSGLSSGEKNLLRMLAQLRYLLVSPTAYKDGNQNDDYRENGKRPNVLRNLFEEPVDEPVDEPETDELQRRDQTCDTLFLLLDEADLTYHPEWQRRFVDLLCAILPEMFRDPYDPDGNTKGGCKDIQVILATHSPLMLGDFPKASTVYLDAGSSGEAGESPAPGSSFGQNLYTILRNGFFMEDSLGEFAKRKINDAAAWCANVRKLAAQEKKLKKKREQSLDQNCESSQEEQRRKELGELKQRRDILKLDLEVHKATARLLSPGIIREKLLLELAECETLLGETRQNKRLEREALERKKQLLREKLKEAELELQALEEDDE